MNQPASAPMTASMDLYPLEPEKIGLLSVDPDGSLMHKLAAKLLRYLRRVAA
jgi:hypothetical protein